MLFILQASYLVALGVSGVMVGCGALLLVSRVAPLVSRQRATLSGVES